MTQKKSLIDKVREEIGKTGFPTELRVSHELRKLKWVVSESKYYIDRDEGKGREIDLTAYTGVGGLGSEPSVVTSSFLSIEVKMSSKYPWVIFTSRKRESDWSDATLMRLYNVRSEPNLIQLYPFESEHPLYEHERVGRTCYVPFSNGSNQAYEAIVSATKACIAEHAKAVELAEVFNPDRWEVNLYSPVVVFDGELFEAWINDYGALEIRSVEALPFSFHYLSPNYYSGNHLVSIVTVAALQRCLNRQKQWLEAINGYLLAAAARDLYIRNLHVKETS